MKTLTKTGIVFAGYACAFALAVVVTYIKMRATANSPDADASSGMHAFGELLVFVFTFGFAALVPSGFAFYFLREVRAFWKAVAVCAAVLAATNVVAGAVYWAQWLLPHVPMLDSGSAFAVLRMLVAPIVMATILVCAEFAPEPRLRRIMRLAAAVEILAATPWFLFLVWSIVSR